VWNQSNQRQNDQNSENHQRRFPEIFHGPDFIPRAIVREQSFWVGLGLRQIGPDTILILSRPVDLASASSLLALD
jgi:hypothetical protein